MNNELLEKVMKMTEELNNTGINVPVLAGHKITKRFNNGFMAQDEFKNIEQLTNINVDKNKSIEELIREDISRTIIFSKTIKTQLLDENIKFIETYKTKYKIYAQDIILENKSYIRQVVTYFRSEDKEKLYLLTLVKGMINTDSNYISTLDNILENEDIKVLIENTKKVIDGIK